MQQITANKDKGRSGQQKTLKGGMCFLRRAVAKGSGSGSEFVLAIRLKWSPFAPVLLLNRNDSITMEGSGLDGSSWQDEEWKF